MMAFQYNFFSLSIWIRECFSSTFWIVSHLWFFYNVINRKDFFYFFVKSVPLYRYSPLISFYELRSKKETMPQHDFSFFFYSISCNGVQREHNKKLNNGLPILHKVPPKWDYGRYFCIMAEKGGTSHGGLTEKLSPFFHAKKQEVNAYGRW